MDLESYLTRKKLLKASEPSYRDLCLICLKPQFGCYCPHVRRLDPKINFVILIHPIEMRRRIATGHLSHRCLEGSHLIEGHDFSENDRVNDLIEDYEHHSLILYPGRRSTNLTELTPRERNELVPKNKKLRIFVIDGTWCTARTMMNHSLNLKQLPMICFTPEQPSRFRVREQPNENCYSTIEAIHKTLDLLSESVGLCEKTRPQDLLLDAFDSLVEAQLKIKSQKARL